MIAYPWLQVSLSQLTHRLAQKALHHGIILSGAEGIGKSELAVAMAQTLLCQTPHDNGACGECQSCQLYRAGTHPDAHAIETEKQIGVDLIRTAISKLNGTAQLGGNKCLVIYAADTMTEAAANALLKTLEEPTSSTYLILVTSQQNKLLPTILSRCEKQHIATPSTSQSLDWLRSVGITELDEDTLRAYSGAPLKAKAVFEGDGIKYSDFIEGVRQIQRGEVTALTLADKWQSDALQVCNWSQLELKKALNGAVDSASFARYQKCIEANQKLAHPGVNKALVLASVLNIFSN